MKIGLLFDRFSIEEKFFLKLNYNIKKINSSKLLIKAEPLEKYDIIINRIESKHRRRRLSKLFEVFGCEVLNNYGLEEVCGSKIETKIALNMFNVPTANAVFKLGFPFKIRSQKYIKQLTETERLMRIVKELKPCVSKPDLGSRGKSIILIKDEEALLKLFNKYEKTQQIPETFKASLITLDGVLLEKFNPHALDLRVVVYKTENGQDTIFGTLARAVASDEILAKNTSLGGVPIGIPTCESVKDIVVKCMRALSKYLSKIYCKELDYYVVGVDVLPVNYNPADREEVYKSILKLQRYFSEIQQAKKQKNISLLDEKFKKFKESDEYKKTQEKCLEYVLKSKLLITEVNTTPDFGYNTRNLIGNPIICYDKVIKSLIN
ncbi:MAG: ATP-grasp domain-containing protein [Candidatus Odinarchaeia archaeon]